MTHSQELLDVKPFQETLHGGYCGPACLKMVLAYYDIEKSESEIAERCGRDPRLGVDDKCLKRVAEEYGLAVEVLDNASFTDIKTWLDKKVPVIVDWFTRGRADYGDSEVPDGHYSVVVGLDDANIYLQDPEIGKLRTLAREDFYRVWFDFKSDHVTSWDEMLIRQLIAIYS